MKLIDKNALVAEIEKRLSYYKDLEERNVMTEYAESGYYEVKQIKRLLDTLEVKEVDLEKEIESYFKGFGKFASVGIDDCIDIAKHFFELGMQVSNKEQKGE